MVLHAMMKEVRVKMTSPLASTKKNTG
jgi:hypothetical protein